MTAIGGIQLGGLVYMALCGFGFLSVLNAVPDLFMAVKIAGAIYLAWLGFSLLRGAIRPQPEAPAMRIGGSPFVQGFLSTVLNPKVAIFFRSAEHTSDIQALRRSSYAVFCLKQKNYNTRPTLQKLEE